MNLINLFTNISFIDCIADLDNFLKPQKKYVSTKLNVRRKIQKENISDDKEKKVNKKYVYKFSNLTEWDNGR